MQHSWVRKSKRGANMRLLNSQYFHLMERMMVAYKTVLQYTVFVARTLGLAVIRTQANETRFNLESWLLVISHAHDLELSITDKLVDFVILHAPLSVNRRYLHSYRELSFYRCLRCSLRLLSSQVTKRFWIKRALEDENSKKLQISGSPTCWKISADRWSRQMP